MAYERIQGGLYFPEIFTLPTLNSTVGLIDATGEKLAIVGRVVWANNAATKDIRRVQFKWGTITKAGGSGLTISLQDVATGAGPTFQPDGTQDQTVAVANGDASFATDTWYRTGTFSADRTAARGDLLAVVIEFDGSGRLGADAVRLCADNSAGGPLGSGVAQFAASWSSSSVSVIANIILEASDGTIGTLDYARPLLTTANETGFNNTSTPDEIGNAFTLPFNCKVDGLWAQVQVANNANFDLCLYKGTTLQTSVSVDMNTVAQHGSSRPLVVPIADTDIEKDVEYFVIVKPTGGSNVIVYGITVNDATHWDVHTGGQACCYASRVDAGSFSKTATKRIWAGVRISQFVEEAGAGGGSAGSVIG